MTTNKKLYELNETAFSKLITETGKTFTEISKELNISHTLCNYYCYRTKEMPSRFIPVFAKYIAPTRLVKIIVESFH